eukprot:255590_1
MGASINPEPIDPATESWPWLKYFSHDELKELFQIFKELDNDNDGYLAPQNVVSLQNNPLWSIVIKRITNGCNKLDFSEFIELLSAFDQLFGTFENRSTFDQHAIQVLFGIYDTNDDGYICREDLSKSMKSIFGYKVNNISLKQMIDHTMFRFNKNKNGKISITEFAEFMNSKLEHHDNQCILINNYIIDKYEKIVETNSENVDEFNVSVLNPISNKLTNKYVNMVVFGYINWNETCKNIMIPTDVINEIALFVTG